MELPAETILRWRVLLFGVAADRTKGILNPFPLLLADEKEGYKPRGPCDLVNPLLLVTERKGMEYSVHYGAFPLDAFHTDGAMSSLCMPLKKCSYACSFTRKASNVVR